MSRLQAKACYSSLPAPNFQPTATQERNDQCGNQHYSCELLMMGIVVPETCRAYRKYNKIISITYLVFILQLLHIRSCKIFICDLLNLLAPELFLKILAHPVYKM